MFKYATKKDRKIANLQTKIDNRDILIEKQEQKIKELEDKNKALLQETSQEYLERKDILCENNIILNVLINIKKLVNNFEFGQNAFLLVRQIKNELAKIHIKD